MEEYSIYEENMAAKKAWTRTLKRWAAEDEVLRDFYSRNPEALDLPLDELERLEAELLEELRESFRLELDDELDY